MQTKINRQGHTGNDIGACSNFKDRLVWNRNITRI